MFPFERGVLSRII